LALFLIFNSKVFRQICDTGVVVYCDKERVWWWLSLLASKPMWQYQYLKY
jgi:hypothetical protein